MPLRSRSNRFAHVLERVGLATAGASCGLFVAAYVAKSGIQGMMTVGFVLAMMVCGAVGFYLGIDMSGRRDDASEPLPEKVQIASSFGTFLAPVAALISVVAIVLDLEPPNWVAILIGLGWLLGVVLQLVAGVTARIIR